MYPVIELFTHDGSADGEEGLEYSTMVIVLKSFEASGEDSLKRDRENISLPANKPS